MDNLSQELVDHITSYFHPISDIEDLAQILTINKAFQNSVERVKLAHYQLNKNNTDKFLRLYTSQRRYYLRHVEFRPTLPISGFDRNPEQGCREQPNDLLEKDKVFTRQIGLLFRTLKCLEDQIGSVITGVLHLTIFLPTRPVEEDLCRHRVFVCWRVHLLHPETLPRLSSIHTFEIKDGSRCHPHHTMAHNLALPWLLPQSKLDLRILTDLASKLVSLEQLECSIHTYFPEMASADDVTSHLVQDWAGPHRDTRHDFARSVESIMTLPNLKSMNLNFHPGDEELHEQRVLLPNLVLPQQYDPFSTSLRLLSHQLETMILCVTADHTLFWPTDGTTPCWPNLKRLSVCFFAPSPSGAWYFEGPQGEGSDASPGYEVTQEHYEPTGINATDRYYDKLDVDRESEEIHNKFRITPNGKVLRPFLVSFANAINKMPSLRKAVLWTKLAFDPSAVNDCYKNIKVDIGNTACNPTNLAWGIVYARPGEIVGWKIHNKFCPSKHFWSHEKPCSSRQFWWMTQDWRPDATLYSLFDRIGQLEHGNKTIHHWPSDMGHKWYRHCVLKSLIKKPWRLDGFSCR